MAEHEPGVRAEMTPRERFMAKAQVDPTGCWRWLGTILPNGYGHFRGYDSQMMTAHRFAYVEFVGPIAEGLQIDHLCRNRWCVNPAHLEAVTCRENALRGQAPNVLLHLSGRCAKGHDRFYYIRSGGRIRRRCRVCESDRQRARRERKKSLLASGRPGEEQA